LEFCGHLFQFDPCATSSNTFHAELHVPEAEAPANKNSISMPIEDLMKSNTESQNVNTFSTFIVEHVDRRPETQLGRTLSFNISTIQKWIGLPFLKLLSKQSGATNSLKNNC
jgi:hypothetical protein